jgi:hypothetical protein
MRLDTLWIIAALAGCGPKSDGSDDGGASTDAETSTATATTGEPTTSGDTSTGCATDGCEPEQFGTVCLELTRGETLSGDPLAATARIVAQMRYEDCLIDFYVTRHPELRLDGPAEAGGAVFAEWKQRLCAEPVDGRIACSVVSFVQTLDEDSMVYSLQVTYEPGDPAALLGGKLLFGPGPLPALAGCGDGDEPRVTLTGLSDLVGLDADAEPLWKLESFGVTPSAVFGGACLQVRITGV